MKRAVEMYQKYIVERFTAQTTDYQALLKVRGLIVRQLDRWVRE